MKLINIQTLRAIAALNVVVFHSIEASKSYAVPARALSFLDGWGVSGVDLFFVISGFVMVYTQHKNARAPASFFRDRIIRIVPIYWLLTLVMTLLLWFMPSMFRQMSYSTEWILASFGFVSKWGLGQNPVLYLGWSIEYELFFYSVFSLMIFLSRNRLVEFWAAIVLLAFVATIKVDPIFVEFVFGMFVGHFYVKQGKKVPRLVAPVALFAGGVVFIGSLWFKDQALSRVLVYGLPASILVFGAVTAKQIRAGFLSALGDASYSLYLVQVFTIPVIYKISRVFPASDQHPDLLIFVSVFATCVAAWVLFRTLELPITCWVRDHFSRLRTDSFK